MKIREPISRLLGIVLLISIPEIAMCDEVAEFDLIKQHKSFQKEESKTRRRKLFNESIESAVTRGLKYLIEQQQPNGFFPGSSTFRENVATTAYSGQALLMARNIWKNKDYHFAVDKAAVFLISHQTERGLILKGDKASTSAIYGHGIALRFLANYFHSNGSKELRTAIERAVELTTSLQQDDGSWGYEFKSNRGGRGDISNTACQMAALLAARDAGFKVKKQVLNKAAAYMISAQKDDGGFLYVISYESKSTHQRSAVVMASLPRLPKVEVKQILKAYQFMDSTHKPHFTNAPFYHYAMTYGIVAYRHRGSDAFCQWYESMSKPLLSNQQDDGSWYVNHVRLGKSFGTATVCMFLQSILFDPGNAKSIKR